MFGLLFICCAALLSAASSSPTTLNNSSLSLVLADQCATREEVREEIQVQTNHLESQKLCATREEVQADIQTQTDHLESQIECVTRQEMQEEIQQLQAQIQNLQNTQTQLRNDIGSIQSNLNQLQGLFTPGSYPNPARSCRVIQGSTSNYYWIIDTKTGSRVWKYCDMTRRCCGQTGGWMQVANLDMTDRNQGCPSGFKLITSPRRMCGRYNTGCVSAIFPVHGVEYSRVCGRVIGYQYRSPDGFWPYHDNRALTIDNTYVDGVSITYGNSTRKHVWTFVGALDETSRDNTRCSCTRNDGSFTGTVPPFVGNDYFCETGSRSAWDRNGRYYTEDPLWNGQGCGSVSTCCSFNNPPWFCKQLPQATRDDIELRLCGDQSVSDEDTPLEIIELYVQ